MNTYFTDYSDVVACIGVIDIAVLLNLLIIGDALFSRLQVTHFSIFPCIFQLLLCFH